MLVDSEQFISGKEKKRKNSKLCQIISLVRDYLTIYFAFEVIYKAKCLSKANNRFIYDYSSKAIL